MKSKSARKAIPVHAQFFLSMSYQTAVASLSASGPSRTPWRLVPLLNPHQGVDPKSQKPPGIWTGSQPWNLRSKTQLGEKNCLIFITQTSDIEHLEHRYHRKNQVFFLKPEEQKFVSSHKQKTEADDAMTESMILTNNPVNPCRYIIVILCCEAVKIL